MDTALAFKKYLENYKLAFSTSILFIFLLFLVDPSFSLYGGSLNLTFNLLNTELANIALTIIAIAAFLVCFSLIQAIIIYRVGHDYSLTGHSTISAIRDQFFELTKFNIVYILVIYAASVLLYDFTLLNNIIIQLIFLIISLLFWFVPQIIILEKESASRSILICATYLKNNWKHMIGLFAVAIILVIIASVIDVVFGVVAGSIISTLFFVMFIIPFIEILKTEVYLDKYNLLKPQHYRQR